MLMQTHKTEDIIAGSNKGIPKSLIILDLTLAASFSNAHFLLRNGDPIKGKEQLFWRGKGDPVSRKE